MLMTQAQPTMPALTDAMRAVLRNEREVYESEDALYAALCDAAGAQPVVNQQMTTDTALADTQRQIIEAAEQRGYARAMAECAQDRQDAERYRWAQQFMRLDDVGDDQYSLGLVIDSERLEGCVSDEAARLDYERNQQRWANVKSPDDEPADIPAVTLNDAIDAAR